MGNIVSRRLPIIKMVCSEDFSPSIVRTKVLTTNSLLPMFNSLLFELVGER
jgi:hypothetical protein